MEYWDKNGNIHNDEAKKKDIIERAYNKLLAGLSNSADWINNENSESDYYKQKAGLLGALTTLGLGGANKYKEIESFLPEIIEGKNLYLTVPYELKNKKDQIKYVKDAEQFFNKNMYNNPIMTEWGKVDFVNNRATETRPEYMWQFPFTRYNLSKSKRNTLFPNYKKEKSPNTEYFDNIEVNMFGKKYDYQIRNNKNDKKKNFYNIKDYDYFLNDINRAKTQYPEIYQEYLDLNGK